MHETLYSVTAGPKPTVASSLFLLEWREHAPIVPNIKKVTACDRRARALALLCSVRPANRQSWNSVSSIKLKWGCSSVGKALDRHAADAGSIPRCGKGFFSRSQLSLQTLLRFHHHHHQSLNLEGRWCTTCTDDFATSFLHFPLFSVCNCMH